MERIVIENFRRIKFADIILAPASFIIGPNNCGKSSVIAAIEALLSLEREKITPNDYRMLPDENHEDKIVLTGYFGSIPVEVAISRGFRGRVIDSKYVYRKAFSFTGKHTIECLEYTYTIKDEYEEVKTVGDLKAAGVAEETITEVMGSFVPGSKLKKGWERIFRKF